MILKKKLARLPLKMGGSYRLRLCSPAFFLKGINEIKGIYYLETITNEMLPATRAFCPNSVLVRELLPYILSVVQEFILYN